MTARLLALRLALAIGIAAGAAPARAAGEGSLTVPIHAADSPGALVVDQVELYRASHALVIGNDAYHNGWPRLSNAVKDARAVADELKRHGFLVTLKTDLDAGGLRQALEEFFVVKGDNPDARLVLWFAGHGYTEGGEGFIVPIDAPRAEIGSRFRLSALAMRRFGEYVRLARAKHVLAVFDACFSGTVFTTQRSLPPRAITAATRLPVRQFISSGDAEQPVFDDGTFRDLFVRGLRGEDGADANSDGFVTASELGLYLTDRVTNLTRARQTPRYGKLLDKDYDRGEFVFRAMGAAPPPVRPPVAAAPPPAATRSSDPIAVELAFWDTIKNSANPADYRAYLDAFPQGQFAALARIRVEAAKPAPPAPPPTPPPAPPPAPVVAAPPVVAPPPAPTPEPSRLPPVARARPAPERAEPPPQVAVVPPPPPPPPTGAAPGQLVTFTPPAPGTRFHFSSGAVLEVVSVKGWTIELKGASGRTFPFIACCAFPNGRGHDRLEQTGCSPPAPSCDYASPEGGSGALANIRGLWPLAVGKETSWENTGFSPYDNWLFTTRTVREETVSVPAGQFRVFVFEIEEQGRARNVYRGIETFWFAPRIGFPVKYEARKRATNALLGSWELTRIEP